MSFKLKDIQELAEAKAREYFMDKGYYCTPSTLLAINDTMKEVDDINYADTLILKATSTLPICFGICEDPCGAASTKRTLRACASFRISEPVEILNSDKLRDELNAAGFTLEDMKTAYVSLLRNLWESK